MLQKKRCDQIYSGQDDESVKRKKAFKTVLSIVIFTAAVFAIVFATNIFIVEDCIMYPSEKPIDDSFLSESILGKNIFLLQAEKVEKHIEEDPSIKSASLRRVFPDSVTIEIVAREKIIQVEYMNGTIGISSDGYVMGFETFSDNEAKEDYLLVKGFEFERFETNSILVTEDYELLENIIMLAKFLKSDIEESVDFVSIEKDHLILQIHKDFIVDFGPLGDPIENKLGKMKLILQDLSTKNINRGIINMRYGNSPVYYPIQ